jgi:hypothetical protein
VRTTAFSPTMKEVGSSSVAAGQPGISGQCIAQSLHDHQGCGPSGPC